VIVRSVAAFGCSRFGDWIEDLADITNKLNDYASKRVLRLFYEVRLVMYARVCVL